MGYVFDTLDEKCVNNLFCFCKKELKDNLTTLRGLRVVYNVYMKMVKTIESVTMNVFMRFAMRFAYASVCKVVNFR